MDIHEHHRVDRTGSIWGNLFSLASFLTVAVLTVAALAVSAVTATGLLVRRAWSKHPSRITAISLATSISLPAWAHNPFHGSIEERAAGWINVLLLLTFWLVYLRGMERVPPSRRQALGFHLVLIICVITILGPLDTLAKSSTAAHMTQHMLLMIVIAPLWTLCRPLPQLMAGGMRGVWPAIKPIMRIVQRPMLAAFVHALAIWLWHLPFFYMLAVDNPGWHTVEHLCFLITAGLFWWAVLKSNARTLPSAMLALLLTLAHTGFLGAILTFSQAPLYGESRDIADQQLAGLIMWVPGGLPYLAAMAWLTARWYRNIAA